MTKAEINDKINELIDEAAHCGAGLADCPTKEEVAIWVDKMLDEVQSDSWRFGCDQCSDCS